jgi:hypothetical protein
MSTVTIVQGYKNPINDQYSSYNSTNWAGHTNWSTWSRWNDNPGSVVIRLDDAFTTSDLRTPTLNLNYYGTLSLVLKTSTTGTFTGEETTYTLSSTAVSIAQARYYRWTITLTASGTVLPILVFASTEYSQSFETVQFKDIDLSTLSGSTTAGRVVTHSFGVVHSVQVTAQQETTWVDRAYALPDSFTDPVKVAPIPSIVNKSPLTILLRDDFGVPVNGIVDISITGSASVYLTDTGVIKL